VVRRTPLSPPEDAPPQRLNRRGVLFAGLFVGALSVVASALAHTTDLPHHTRDFADIATGQDRRGIVMLLASVLTTGLIALAYFVFRNSVRHDGSSDVLRVQERLRARALHAASHARKHLDRPQDDLIMAVVDAYASQTGGAPAQPLKGEPGRYRIGTDVLAVRATTDSVDLTASSEGCAASVRVTQAGDITISLYRTPTTEAAL